MVAEKENQRFVIKNNILVGKAYKTGIVTTGISELLLKSLNGSPDFVGQIDLKTDKQITFAEMKDRSIRCALWLRKQGIGKDDIVCVSTPNQVDDYIPCFATYFVGAIFNPWFYDTKPKMAESQFELIQPKVMFACENSISVLASTAKAMNLKCKFIVFGRHPEFPSLSDLLAEQSDDEVANFQPEQIDDAQTRIGTIHFSSGTSGIQKGSALSYETLVNTRVECIRSGPGCKMLWYSTLSWITGTILMSEAVTSKSTRFIHDKPDPEETCLIIEQNKINWVFITPHLLTDMWKSKILERVDFSSVQTLIIAGSKISSTVCEYAQNALPHALVANSYGMSELGGWATAQTRDKRTPDSVGYIVDTIKVKIIDPATGQILGPNQRGEVCFKLKNCMLGYYKNTEENKKIFDDEGWIHSGDEGYYDETGELNLTDRLKMLIKVRNHQIAPGTIEDLLMQHPDVLEAAVFGVPHKTEIERPIAFVKLHPKAKVTKEELQDLSAQLGENYRLTGGVVFVDEIPHNSNGKKNIKIMKELAKQYTC